MSPVSNSVLAFTLTAAVLFSSADAEITTHTVGVDCGFNWDVEISNTDTWRCCSSSRAKGVEYVIDPDESKNAYHTAKVYITDTDANVQRILTATKCEVKESGATCTGDACYYEEDDNSQYQCYADSCCYDYYYEYCLEVKCEHGYWSWSGPCKFNYIAVTFDNAVPDEWTCQESFYAADDGCDCGCGARDPDCDTAGVTVYGCDDSSTQTGECTAWGTCDTLTFSPPPPSPLPPPPPPPPPPACTATTTPGDDGSSGLFWCINGGTVSGMAPNCECQNCGSGFGGANCADANACSASTDESKTTGADGEFWCINRGTIGGSAGDCSCTCKTGYSGDHCQTANDCTATDVLSAESSFGSDGTFYCINGGTVGGVTLNCTCTDCNPGYGDDRCAYKQICTASSDESKTTGSDGTFYCINGGTASGLTEDCVCIGCNTGWEGDHCEIAKACSGSRDSSKTTGDDGKYYCEHGTVSGTTESCLCTDCATGYDGTHCQTAKSCTPSSDQDMTSGANGEFYCINGGSIGGVTESCTCTGCNVGYGGDHCETAQTCTASTIKEKTGADGEFYCINGGEVIGTTGDCTCQNCNTPYGGVNCATSGACSASTDESKTTGADGEFYCINGGTISGTQGLCECTCADGYSGDHCQTANACTVSSDESKTTGADGTFYCINDGTISGNTGHCRCTCKAGYDGDHCETIKMCTISTDESKTTGADGEFYCINGGAVGGVAEACTCTACNAGYEGDHCQTGKTCTASSNSTKTTGSDATFYCINGGVVGGTLGSCTCTICNAGYAGAHCHTAKDCTASSDESENGAYGTIYCTTGGIVGGSTGSCTCTCKAGYTGAGCKSGSATVTTKEKAEKSRDTMLNGVTDAKLKKKAKLLADAAISGKKVRKMSAKLSAPDEDTACSDYYTKAGLDRALGACVATAASRRRALAASTYDVSVFFSEAEVDEATMTAAANSLKAEGVTGVDTTNGIDPIAELKTIAGIDSNTVDAFKTEAAAAAAEAPLSPPPPLLPPPTPSPNLIQDEDDDDHAPAVHGLIFLLTMATLNFLL